jgi:hypothetical protein
VAQSEATIPPCLNFMKRFKRQNIQVQDNEVVAYLEHQAVGGSTHVVAWAAVRAQF